jgi:hypothetical protein
MTDSLWDEAQTVGDEFSSVVAFYGIKGDACAIEEACHRILRWFGDHGHTPEMAGATGRGYPNRLVSLTTLKKRFSSSGFAAVESFEFVKLLPEARSPGDFLLAAQMARQDPYLAIGVKPSIQSLTQLVDSAAVEDLFPLLNPGYVIAYERENLKGPMLYAVGLVQGLAYSGAEYEEGRNISRWGDMGMSKQVFNFGLLRDVYRVNFLNASQLKAKVGSTYLCNWIEQDVQRGHLSPAKVGLQRWDVPQEAIRPLRRALWEAGVIFDWRRHSEMS